MKRRDLLKHLELLADVTQNQMRSSKGVLRTCIRIPSVRPPERRSRAGKQEREGEGTKGCVRISSVMLQLNCESTI